MMKLLALLGIVALVCAAHTEDEYRLLWSKFRTQHNKIYKPYEEGYRYAVFKMNLNKIEKFMSNSVDTQLAMNAFGDMSHEEFAAVYLGHRFEKPHITAPIYHSTGNDLPTSVDWVKAGAVTAVKDQGQCGSCYAFSAVGSMEGAHWKKTSTLVSLSESQIVDCSAKYGNEGCDGGEMSASIQYVIDNGGIDTEACYPYEAVQRKCAYKSTCIGATMSGMYNVTEGSEADLADALVNRSPIAVAIDASDWSFQFYSGGVYDPSSCSTTELDHGVTLVGYNTPATGKAYWVVKNSWGKSWGISGYIWMRKGINRCGIATQATVAIA